MQKHIAAVATLTLLILFTNIEQSHAHEFWIEPEIPVADMNIKMRAHVRVGQNFKGPDQYYLPDEIEKIEIYGPKSSFKIHKTIGDNPIFDELAKSPGLQILTDQSTPFKLTYATFAKFEKFVRNVGLKQIVAEHKKRALPEVGFSEFYIRYGKALLARGNTNGKDKKVGFKIELIAQINPYEFDPSATNGLMPVMLLWNDQPLKNAQISVFKKIKDGAKMTKILTNGEGLAKVPVAIGQTYMLNAVQITEEKPENGAVWKSHWASLTFTIAEKQ